MGMKKVMFSVCLAGALLAFSSCRSSKNVMPQASLAGEWNIVELNGTAVVPAPGQEFPFIGINADNGNVYGNTSCNRIMGTVDLNGKPGEIDLSSLGSTRMACPDMTLEQNILAALKQVNRYQQIDDKNVALCASKRPVIILQRKDETTVSLNDLNGKWMVREVYGSAVPDTLETQPFMEFDAAAKRLHGNAGCNTINGGIQTDENNAAAIAFPQLISTMMACPDMKLESNILKALNEVKSFGKLQNGGIGFYSAENALLLVLER